MTNMADVRYPDGQNDVGPTSASSTLLTGVTTTKADTGGAMCQQMQFSITKTESWFTAMNHDKVCLFVHAPCKNELSFVKCYCGGRKNRLVPLISQTLSQKWYFWYCAIKWLEVQPEQTSLNIDNILEKANIGE